LRKRRVKNNVSQKSALGSLFWGKREEKMYAQRLPTATASVQPPSDTHTQRCGQRKSIASNENYIRACFPATKSARAPSRGVPSGARARARRANFKPSTPSANKKFRGVSEKSRERTLTMLDRPWRYLSGENPIRLQNPVRIEICFDVRNVNNVCAMCADFASLVRFFLCASRLFWLKSSFKP